MSYFQPASLGEALEILGEEDLRVVAGCTDFFPSQPMGGQCRAILDLTRVAGLRGIDETAEGWRIGATTTWTDVIRAPLPPAFDALKLAAREVGSVQIQNLGTLAGNICNASPAADGVPPLLALEAAIEVASAGGTRRMPLSRFITHVRATDLGPGEMVTALHIPRRAAAGTSAFLKLGSRKYMVISIAMVAANIRVEDGHIADLRVAVGSCSPVAMRLTELETALTGQRIDRIGAMPDAWFAALGPLSDVRGSSAYRLASVAELCARTIHTAATAKAEPC